MKKQILLILLLLSIFTASFAEEEQSENLPDTSGGFYLETGIGAGLQFGIVTENFYRLFSTTGLYQVSWLNWQMMPACLGTVNVKTGYEFNNNRSINFEAYFSSTFPTVTGSMEDFDALKFDDRITDFSHHDNYTDLFIDTGLYFDYSFPNGFGLGINFEYKNVKFRAQNGYAQHTSNGYGTYEYWSPDMPHTSDYTGNTVITYDFFSFYWKPGIVWRYGFTDRIHLGIDAWFCLYRFDHALDIHYVANVPHDYYTDIVEKWFSGLDVRATANYAFTDHFSLSLRVAGEFLPPAYDDDYVGVPPDTKINKGYKGGFDAWSVSATVFAIMRF